MKSAILFLVGSGLAIVLAGCSTFESGNPRIENIDIVEQVIEGKTRSEVHALLGAPGRIETDVDGKKRWFYKHFDGWQPWIGPVFGEQTRLIIHFKIDDTVDYSEWSNDGI